MKGARIADAPARDDGGVGGEIDHGRRFHAAVAAVDDGVHFMLQGVADVPGVGHGQVFAGQEQGGAHHGFVQGRQQVQGDAAVGHAQADGLAFGVHQAFRHVLGGREDEGVGAGGGVLEQTEGAVFDAGVDGQFLEIPADQGEIVILIQTPNAADALQSGFVAQMAAQSVARVGGIRDDPALADDVHGAGDETRLGIVGVDGEELAHGENGRG